VLSQIEATHTKLSQSCALLTMTMKKFSKTLTFDSSCSNENSQSGNGRQRLSVTRLTAKMSNQEREQYSRSSCQPRTEPLDTKISIDYATGLNGLFMPIKNDFSVLDINTTDGDFVSNNGNYVERYRDESHWPREAKKKVKRVRFLICTLALFGLALGLMSRLILNVSIVEMIKKPDVVPGEDLTHEKPSTEIATEDELLFAATNEAPDLVNDNGVQLVSAPSDSNHTTTLTRESLQISDANNHNDGLHFQWSKQDVNIVLGSFYMGYAPSILFSGSVAERYGAKYPMFVCIFGSAVINILTPLVARTSVHLLIGSRVVLGIIQGSLMPCMYELFNRWLTKTESSIFAPMIKVSMPMGSLIGTIMPGILASFKLEWPNLFYIGGFMCLVWSLVWLALATSLPQTNRFVGINELNRIMRKKKTPLNQPATITEKVPRLSSSSSSPLPTSVPHSSVANGLKASRPTRGPGTPWFLIITSPSVLALTVVKFTYNIGMDFIVLQVAVYLREVHNAPIETISAIASGGYGMQMLLISFVGWLAKVVVIKQACGLSVTKWRKIFQGSSNFVMAATYVILAYSNPSLEVAAILIMSVCFWWMMGAGGESMLPYDLSAEYPASIVGFAHSFSIFSGVVLATICDAILGEDTEDPEKWSSLFYVIAGLLAGGGLIFVAVVKAKPFLPGEKQPKLARQARSVSTVRD
jgi:ACS family sodium-dependent inorganic phosphate cotransporter